MRTIGWLFFSGCWVCLNAIAQNPAATLTGRVLDAKTHQPVPFGTVYVNNSTRGTTADSTGRYRLTNVPLGDIELVGSALGYKTVRQPLRLTDPRQRTIELSLEPSDNALSAVTVKARHDRSWLRQFRQFSRELLGNQPLARECRIMNENVLSFREEKGRLRAQATEQLVIENGALGYRLFYDLLFFDLYRGEMHFAGNSRFDEMTTTDSRQRLRWQANRLKAYRGSLRHLMASLLAGTHEQEGYSVYRTPLMTTGSQTTLSLPLVRTTDRQYIGSGQAITLFRPGELAFERRLVSDVPLEVYYDRIYARNSPYRDSPAAYSLLLLPNKELDLTTTGWINQPKGLDVRGYLGNDRLATLLPADWVPTDQETLVATDVRAGRLIRTDTQPDSLRAERRRQRARMAPIVYVHTDKSLYVTGDHLWFSAYVLDPVTHLPVIGRSGGPLHVELMAPGGQSVQHQWLPLTDGRGAGAFRLADTLLSGTYRLRAYTDADPLAGGPGFEYAFPIRNLRQPGNADESQAGTTPLTTPQAPSSSLRNDQLDVQFLPEGGRWLVGVPGRLGIKALKSDGRGIAVHGRIVDESGTEIVRFTTNRLGMGHVLLSPQVSRSYAALVDQPAGAAPQRIALPPAEPEGLTLSADALSDSSRIWVTVRAVGTEAEQPVSITLHNQEQMVYRETWQLRKGELNVALPTATLLPGVCRLTLTDGTGRPRAERLVFVPERTAPVQLRVVTGKPRYQPRDTMAIGLQLRDADNYPVVAMWSAAVTDADQLPVDTTVADLRTYLLLTGGLRGPVESPAHYLDHGHVGDIDDLLLTQGWRRLLNLAPADSTGGWTLSGHVRDARGRPIPQEMVMLLVEQGGQQLPLRLRTDERGAFRLGGLTMSDTVRVRGQVLGPKGVGAVLTFDAPGRPFATPAMPVTDGKPLAGFLAQARVRQLASPTFYRDSTARQLAEVIVRAAKPRPERPDDVQRASLHGSADGVLVVEPNGPVYTTMGDLLSRVPGINLLRMRSYSSFGDNSPLFMLDGIYLDKTVLKDVLDALNPTEISRVELLTGPTTAGIYGARSANGVIAMYTRKGNGDPLPPPTRVATIVSGYASAREFYVPRPENYDMPRVADQRDVLFWQPLGLSDADGLGRLVFPLSDTAKRLRIVVQGVTNEGAPISFVWVLPVR